jgi:hypothetical protein
MMKNWLIRTKNNHILGPISLIKLKDLIENGSVKSDDEICSGNGYWFYIKEKELVEKYIYREKKQGFNPISEAKSVLTPDLEETYEEEVKLDEMDSSSNNIHLPKNEDLEYPDLSDLADVGSDLSLSDIAERAPINELENDEESFDDDLGQDLTNDLDDIDDDFLDEEVASNVVNLNQKLTELDKKLEQYEQKLAPKRENVVIPQPTHAKDKKNKIQAPEIPATLVKKPFFSLNMLIAILICFLLFLFFAFYFRASIIDFLRSDRSSSSFFNVAYAQESRLLVEKKKL